MALFGRNAAKRGGYPPQKRPTRGRSYGVGSRSDRRKQVNQRMTKLKVLVVTVAYPENKKPTGTNH